MTEVTEIQHCEVCGSTDLTLKLDLGEHPLCDDLIPVHEPLSCAEYPISIVYCKTCSTAHQRYQVEKKTLFPQTYHYRAKHTQDVQAGMMQLVTSVKAGGVEIVGKTVLDIGCNDGSLLNYFAQEGGKTFGIEPTGAAEDALAAGHSVQNVYFDVDAARAFAAQDGKPDIITFTNVFAHIEDLKGVLEALKILVSDKTVIVIENHYLGAVIDRDQFDTFYHEHPRTYSLGSFVHIAASLGMAIRDFEFPQRYGGNIRVFLHVSDQVHPDIATKIDAVLADEAQFGAGLDTLARRVEIWKDAKRRQIDALVAEHGPLPAKAFPGRAAILVKLLGLTTREVSAVYERDTSIKVGNKLPGTDIPIVADSTFDPKAHAECPLLNLAWHISAEIEGFMHSRGFEGPIVDIVAPEDFVPAA